MDTKATQWKPEVSSFVGNGMEERSSWWRRQTFGLTMGEWGGRLLGQSWGTKEFGSPWICTNTHPYDYGNFFFPATLKLKRQLWIRQWETRLAGNDRKRVRYHSFNLGCGKIFYGHDEIWSRVPGMGFCNETWWKIELKRVRDETNNVSDGF